MYYLFRHVVNSLYLMLISSNKISSLTKAEKVSKSLPIGLTSYIYTSISIVSISFTGRMKFIPRWTPLALSPRKGTENTNDVRNSPLFLDCCYFKIASTRCKAILIASLNKFRISQYRLRLLLFTSFYSVYVQFNQKRFT